ncbi:clathrin adaptor complexes medium subunit family protein [Tanacetum coccineum]
MRYRVSKKESWNGGKWLNCLSSASTLFGQKGESKPTDKAKPSSGVTPLTFISAEKLSLELHSNRVKRFNLMGLLELNVADLKNRDFKIKIENRGSPYIRFKPNSSKIDKGIFAHKSLLVWKGHESSFPAGQSRPLHWTLNTKEKCFVPIEIKCETSAVGEQTKVMIEYNAFSLFNLVDVHISVPSREAPLDKPINEVGSGSIEFLVPGVVDLLKFFPILVNFKASSTYSNLKLYISHYCAFQEAQCSTRVCAQDKIGDLRSTRSMARSEKMLTWHDFSQPTKEPVFDSVTPRSLPQHDCGTPCKDSVCESVIPSQVIEDVMIQPSFEETELDGEAGFRDVFGDINLSFVSQQASSSQVIEDVMMQLSFEETELDGKASFGDVAGILKVQGYVMMSLFELKT